MPRTNGEIAADLRDFVKWSYGRDIMNLSESAYEMFEEAASALERRAPAVTREQVEALPTYFQMHAGITLSCDPNHVGEFVRRDAVLRLIDGAASGAKICSCGNPGCDIK